MRNMWTLDRRDWLSEEDQVAIIMPWEMRLANNGQGKGRE